AHRMRPQVRRGIFSPDPVRHGQTQQVIYTTRTKSNTEAVLRSTQMETSSQLCGRENQLRLLLSIEIKVDAGTAIRVHGFSKTCRRKLRVHNPVTLHPRLQCSMR